MSLFLPDLQKLFLQATVEVIYWRCSLIKWIKSSLYDIFSHFAPDLQCDLLVTVGSQVGFFQELALLANASAGGFTPGSRVSRPGNIVRWLNVFDTVDVLAFTTQPVFAGVEDFAFSSETGAISAHTAYFWTPHFHRRLGRRIREALV